MGYTRWVVLAVELDDWSCRLRTNGDAVALLVILAKPPLPGSLESQGHPYFLSIPSPGMSRPMAGVRAFSHVRRRT